MRLGEHIFDLQAGVDIPLRHVVIPHGLLVLVREELGGLALSDDLHDFERHARLYTLMHQIGHDAVTRTDYLRDGAGTVLNEFLRIAKPHVCAVRQAGNLQQVGEGLRLCLHEHTANEIRAHLRDGERSRRPADLLGCHAERLRAGAQLNDLAVANIHVHHRDARHILQVLVEGGHIVAKLIEL